MLVPLGLSHAMAAGLPLPPSVAPAAPRRSFPVATARNNNLGQVLTTVTFNSSTVWTAPKRTIALESLIARGGTGSPSGSYTVQQYTKHTTVTNSFTNGTPTRTLDGGTTYNNSGPTPADYCEPPTTFTMTDSNGLNPYQETTQTCYSYTNTSYTQSYSASYGPDTHAFGITFPGGYGGAGALITSPVNPLIEIEPGRAYQIDVGSGGSVSFSYWE